MARPPVVDRLDTRLLERRQVVRSFVRRAAVVERTASGIELAAELMASTRFTSGRADPSDRLPGNGEVRPARVRIEAVGQGVVRVRFAEGDAVPENPTPMLVGPVDPIPFEGSTKVDLDLKPLTLRIGDVCVAGGREKNRWNLWDTYNTGVNRTVPGGRPIATECFALRPGEAVYGFGEQFLRLDKVGQTIDLNMVEATGTTTPRSYKNVPFFVTTEGYGVFFNHSARMTCWVGSRGAADIQVGVEDDFLDYFVILGDIRTVLDRYTDLTGKGAVPPLWSFGWWQSKISYRSAEETLAIARRLRAAEVPFDVLHLDTHWFRRDWFCDLEFDPERFPDPAGYLAEMASLGVKVSLWQLPYIPEPSRLFSDLEAVDGFVKTTGNDLYDIGISFATTDAGIPVTEATGGRVGLIDFTNPDARRVYGDHLRRLFDLGARVIKVDFGEQAPLDGVWHDGTPGHRAHNLYPLLYNRTVSDVTADATGDRVIWARSAWAGSQRYPLHWGGDSSASFDNLIPQIEGGLSLGLSGFQFWSQDIGGFLGRPDGRLLVRWIQAGMFLSHARIHGFGDRELDTWDDETFRIGRDYIRLRYRLLPYLWGQARDSVARSLPMARPLVVEFQDDPSTWRIGDQWLLGDSLLVAPIFDERDRRRVYLPGETGWTDWWTGERTEGGRWLDVEAPREVLPLWVRDGSLIPLWPVLQHVGERPIEEVTVRVAPFPGDGERAVEVPVDGTGTELVTVRYRAAAGTHRVEVESNRPTPVRFALDPFSPTPVTFESSAERAR